MKTRCSRQVTLFSIIALLLLSFQACKKDAPSPLEQLPPETQEGKNTFACLVNGNVWQKASSGFMSAPGLPTLEATYWKGRLQVSAKKLDTENKEYLSIQVNSGVYTTGTYHLAANPESYGSFEIQNNCKYETNNLNTGTLEITRLDTINFIISGRFSFTVAKPGCETVHITDGRFDVKYSN